MRHVALPHFLLSLTEVKLIKPLTNGRQNHDPPNSFIIPPKAKTRRNLGEPKCLYSQESKERQEKGQEIKGETTKSRRGVPTRERVVSGIHPAQIFLGSAIRGEGDARLSRDEVRLIVISVVLLVLKNVLCEDMYPPCKALCSAIQTCTSFPIKLS